MTDCPTQAQLDQLFAGELPPAEETRLWRHVDNCPTCARLEPASDDRYVELVAHLKRLDLSGLDLDDDTEPDLDANAVRRRRPMTDDTSVADQIPGYDIKSEIHRGGQGVVYEAIQRSTNRRVAIKVLLAGRFATAETQRRFEREIELVAGLKHPGIVAVFDSGRTRDDRLFCVMDLVQGRPLDAWLAETRPTPTRALDLFCRICDAVHYAHQRGVIHRDLKPSNILIENDGAPKVLDFGLARSAGSTEQLVSMTGQILGTLPYMSPEQARGAPDDIDIRTDVYSLGVVLFEMLTGRYPYAVDGSIAEALKNIVEATPQKPSRLWSPDSGIFTPSDASRTRRRRSCPVDEDLDTIVFKALAKEKTRRYQTALDLARDVRHYLAGDAIVARRDSTWYVLRKTMRRHRAGVIAVIAFFALLTAWGAAITIGYAREREQKRELDAKSRDATIQRDRAIQAESRAVARFNQIREIAESFLFEFHDAIRDLPGSTEAREFVVSRALMYLDKIAVDSKDDPELLRGLVAGYLKVGDVQGGLGFANLGDTQGALDSYERAAQLALHWSGAAPDDPAPLRALADARRRIGATLATQGEIDDALAAYRTSRSDIERLLASDPDNPQYQQDLQKVESCIGTALATAWRYDDANAAFDRALAINESLVERDPDNPTHRRDLVVVLLKQVRAAINTNQPPEGWIAKTDRSIDLLRGLNDDTSDNVTILRDLAIAYDFKAESFLKSKDLQSALTQYEENLALAKRLHELDPKNALAKNDLMVAHNNVARTLLAFERNEEAIRQFEQGLDIARALVAADRSNYDAVRNVGRSHHYVAMAKLGMEDIDGAIASATASLEAFDEVATHDPANTAVLRDIANLLGLRGDLYIGIADDEAQPADRRIEMYQKSIPDFTQFRAILIQLKDAGKLSEQEAPIIDALQAEVDRCNAAIATLKSGI